MARNRKQYSPQQKYAYYTKRYYDSNGEDSYARNFLKEFEDENHRFNLKNNIKLNYLFLCKSL